MQPERLDGTAAVKDGQLVVVAPGPGGRPARVTGAPGVELRVHGMPVEGPVEVLAGDELEVVLAPDAPHVDVEVVVAEDGLSAALRVDRTAGAHYRLEDQPPNPEILLRRRVAERWPCRSTTIGELRAALAAAGVVHGVVPEVLERLVDGGANEVVARGTVARPAAPGRIVPHALGGAGDARPFVRTGTLLVEVVPPQPGTDGIDVRGQVLPAGDASSPTLRIGEGARLDDDGRVLATVDGHATLHEGTVLVRDHLVVEGDADGTTASQGSVEVQGGVLDHARVRARGDILVHGPVRRAAVEAGGSLVLIAPATDSQLRAGHRQDAARHAAAALRMVAAEFDRLDAAVAQVLAAAHAAGRPLPSARAVTLAEGRVAAELEAHIRAAMRAAEQDHALRAESARRLRDTVATLGDVRMGRRPPTMLATLTRAWAEEADALCPDGDDAAILAVPALERATVDVAGTLRIDGRGAVDCTIAVRGRVEAEGADTVVRGGVLRVDGEARLAEAGGRGGLEIHLAPGARLRVGLAHAGLVVHLPDEVHRVTGLTRDLALDAPAAA